LWFDPNAGEAHHHFVCVQWGRFYELRPEGLVQVRLPGGHRSDRMDVVFRGRCRACAAAVDSPAS
jgi:Fe2+ or Zn2+ uptake regulation protein